MFGVPLDFTQMRNLSLSPAIAVALLLVPAGCGRDGSSSATGPDSVKPLTSTTIQTESTVRPPAEVAAKSDTVTKTSSDKFEFKPLSLNGVGGTAAETTNIGSNPDPEQQIRIIIGKLQPLQVLLGKWRGTTRREYEAFKAVDIHEWVWDLRTKPEQPALTIQSDKSPYIKSGRMTWDPRQNQFSLSVSDPSGTTRQFIGDFTDPVHEILGSDDKLHRVFRLEFNQTAEADGGELWQLAFAQQENNRYLLEVGKRRGKADFARFDTVSTQREGTSFAISDSGYAEKTCIISEGLGTMEVTYKGRSYWVCCTGCKAAFEEDPETWIARAAKKDMPQPK